MLSPVMIVFYLGLALGMLVGSGHSKAVVKAPVVAAKTAGHGIKAAALKIRHPKASNHANE